MRLKIIALMNNEFFLKKLTILSKTRNLSLEISIYKQLQNVVYQRLRTFISNYKMQSLRFFLKKDMNMTLKKFRD